MKLEIGQSVVHLSHGVGQITGIESRDFGKGPERFYILTIQDNGAPKKVFVPEASAGARVRPVISRLKVKAVLDRLSSEPDLDYSSWNKRYREYMERIHTGDILEVASVAAALNTLRNEKDLSFGERKLFDQALNLLRAELSIAMNTSEQAAEDLIMRAMEGDDYE